jgi:hypothetical protein
MFLFIFQLVVRICQGGLRQLVYVSEIEDEPSALNMEYIIYINMIVHYYLLIIFTI